MVATTVTGLTASKEDIVDVYLASDSRKDEEHYLSWLRDQFIHKLRPYRFRFPAAITVTNETKATAIGRAKARQGNFTASTNLGERAGLGDAQTTPARNTLATTGRRQESKAGGDSATLLSSNQTDHGHTANPVVASDSEVVQVTPTGDHSPGTQATEVLVSPDVIVRITVV